MQLPIGILLDRFGPKKVLVVSLLLCVLGTLLLGFLPSSQFVMACCSRFLIGIGAASALMLSDQIFEEE